MKISSRTKTSKKKIDIEIKDAFKHLFLSHVKNRYSRYVTEVWTPCRNKTVEREYLLLEIGRLVSCWCLLGGRPLLSDPCVLWFQAV